MCGIVGTIGKRYEAQEVLLDGLRRLEYRGYDSAGIAVSASRNGESAPVEVRRAVGKLGNLEQLLRDAPLAGHVGIGHTRWATHGKPTERNAHPHRAGSVVIVHNGIVENYRELREELEAEGCDIRSETDTELIAHMIDRNMQEGADLLGAVRAACRRVVGSYAFGAMCADTPTHLVAAKNGGSPIILGMADGQAFIGSDIPAILPYTRQMIFMADGDFAVLDEERIQVVDIDGRPVDREFKTVNFDPVSAEKGGYDRFMQKEIFEQPRAITDTIGTRINEAELEVDLDGIEFTRDQVEKMARIALVACGTASYACMLGKYMIERIAGVPCEVDLASEFRYRSPILDPSCLVVAVSQSGETADTLAALREGREQGARTLAITNTRESSIARESDDVLYTRAGPEIGVASTKCFMCQVVALYLLALRLAAARGRLGADELRERIRDLQRLPRLVEATLDLDEHIQEIAHKYFRATDFLFLGRGIMFPSDREPRPALRQGRLEPRAGSRA